MPKDKSRLWALVMNSARARVVRGLTPHGQTPETELVMKSEARHLREIMSDKPGREFSSGSAGQRSAMEYHSDPVAQDRREFIAQALALLETHRRAGEFDKLAIFAEHEVLGALRPMLPESLRAMVVCEVPKNLVHLAADDLTKAISESLASGPQPS